MKTSIFIPICLAAGLIMYAFGSIERPATASIQQQTAQSYAKSWDANGKFPMPVEYKSVDEKKKWALLRDIMECESNSRWVVVTVPNNGQDAGPCQISTKYHAVRAANKGYDLLVPSENMLYCIDLFEEYHADILAGKWSPWENSKACWSAIQASREKS